VLKRLLVEVRIALLGYRPGDPMSCETCRRELTEASAFWANGFPFCDPACSERHCSYLLGSSGCEDCDDYQARTSRRETVEASFSEVEKLDGSAPETPLMQ
jgi:hypothetical protein